MIDAYLQIFYEVCIAFVPLIVPVFGIYLILMWIGSLLFDRP